MSITEIINGYMRKEPTDQILEMYRQCDLGEVSTGYEKMGLLHIASRFAHPEALEYLLEQGLDPNELAGNGELPIFLLAGESWASGHSPRPGDMYKSACLLLDARASTLRKDERDMLCYHYAAKNGNHEFLQALLDKGVNLRRTDDDGNTGLHLCAAATYNPVRDLESARKMVADKKEEANLPANRRTPVSLEELQARVRKQEERLDRFFKSAAIFLQAEVDPEAKNDMLETAHKLAMRNKAKKLTALLDGSYSPEDEGDPEAMARLAAGGMTLHEAVRQRDLEAVRAIVAAGADVNEISDQEGFVGLSALATACLVGDAQTAEALLELGADAGLKGGDGRPAVAYLFTNQIMIHGLQNLYRDKLPQKMVRLMHEKGFDINDIVTDEGDTLIGLACRSPFGGGSGRDTVKYMVVNEALRLKADPDIPNRYGQTPLMLACAGDFDAMEPIQILLLEAGADVGAKDAYGNTALHYAACNSSQRGALTLSELLFEVGKPDAGAVNNEGKTALDYATERDNEGLVKFLLMQV